ncbi:MAG: Macrolide export protein MacA [Verrucomicrobia subdivision 3 bacterium]|nr:Macrolide export protein MacA [Limisphaerales bacterium]MCS1414364.1 Macrolide export protein MacA [Limisphaerales bacterium]
MSKKSSPWKKWLFVLIVLGVGWFVFKRHKGSEEKQIEFRTVAVARGDLKQVVTASGQLEPVVNVEVGSQISGTLEDIYVDFNSIVTNQQPLARIDARSYENSLKQAQGELASAKAALELAEINAHRAEELHKDSLISQSDYDTVRADLHRAQATKLIREASMDRASIDLSRTTIYSPIDGIVISRNVEVGQTVAASFNTPKLFGIANDLSEMHIHASVSEADIGGVAEGQDVEFTVDAFPTTKMTGIVHQVRNAAVTNQNVISYTTVIAVENSGSRLKPGMTANVEIILAEATDVLSVPNAAFRVRVPEGVEVIGQTAGAEAQAGPGDGGRAGRRGGGDGPGGSRRQQMLERFDKNKDGQLDESERAAMREMFQAQGGGGRRQRPVSRPSIQTVYLWGNNPDSYQEISQAGRRSVYKHEETGEILTEEQYERMGDDKGSSQPKLKAVQVRTGISDGSSTMVLSGLSEGDEVVTSVIVTGGAETSGRSTNPFGPSFGRGRGGRR